MLLPTEETGAVPATRATRAQVTPVRVLNWSRLKFGERAAAPPPKTAYMLGRLAGSALPSQPISRPRNRAGARPRPSPPSRDSAAAIRRRTPVARPRVPTSKEAARAPQAPPTASTWASPADAPSVAGALSLLGCPAPGTTGGVARGGGVPTRRAPFPATQPNWSPFRPHAAIVLVAATGHCTRRRLSVFIAIFCRHTGTRVTIPSPLMGA